ncbi:MAG TPA: MBL fold metallo-hydrolase [Methylomirabilota bacterium]
MRVTMLGHATVLCETEDVRILMDPWILGPANFRSWWHLPDVPPDLSGLPPLDYLYISHLHGDHFHEPTLEKLSRDVTVLVPRLYHDRLVTKLGRLGYRNILELSHAREVALSAATRVTCMQMGNDSVLALADSSAAMVNANDALQGGHPDVKLPLLQMLRARYDFDIAFLSFGTAGAFPKCYQIEDMSPKSMDPWTKERAMLRNFVNGATIIAARHTVPFAGGFALLADRLMWMNEAKTTPADALEALRASGSPTVGLEMNPGDQWDSREGLAVRHAPVDWSRRLDLIEGMRETHAAEVERIDREDHRGPADLPEFFQRRLTQNLHRFPLLRRRLGCSLLFDVEGDPGGQWEVDLRRPSGWFRSGDSGEWVLRIRIPSRLLAEVLADPDGWETLGIAYKLDLYIKKGARAKEGLVDRLMNTPSPFWFLRTVLAPRFAQLAIHRRQEFSRILRAKLTAS